MRVHPLLPALLLALCLGGSIGWRALGDAPHAPPAPQDAPSEPPTAAPLAESAPPRPTAAGEDDDNAPAVQPAESSEDRTAVETPIEPPNPLGPLVRVFDRKRPVAGIEVHWIPFEDGVAARKQQMQQRGLDPQSVPDLDLAQLYGKHAATAEDGTLRLPPVQRLTLISVADPAHARFAAGWAQPGTGEVTLTLAEDEVLRVRVRDAEQRPQSQVPIGVYRGDKFGESELLWTGHTLADGIAEVRHFQIAREPQKGPRFAAAIAVPMLMPVAVEFSGTPAPKDPVDLVLPSTIPVQVRVLHQRGAPILSEVPIRFAPVRPEKFALPLPLGARFDVARATKALGEGVAEFPHLQAGIDLVPVLSLRELGPVFLPPLKLPTNGPTPLLLTLTLPPDLVVLAGTAVRTDGSALANADFPCNFVAPRGANGGLPAFTLPDGRFDLVWRNRDPSQTWRLQCRETDVDGVVLMARTDPQALPPGERRDLGAVRFQPAEVLAFGDVRDDRGQPVEGAIASLELLGPSRRGGGDEWQPAGDGQQKQGRSDAEGNFTVVGLPPDRPMRLSVWKEQHQPFRTDTIGKGSQFHVRLIRNGVLKGRVLLPEWLPKNAATMQLTSAVDPKREYTIPLPQRGDFTADGLVPDVYTARIRIRNLPRPIYELTQIRVDPGENRDRQLDPLDLAGSVHRYRLRAMGPSGPLTTLDGPILWSGSDKAAPPIAFRWVQGKAELITSSPSIEITTVSQGFLPAKFTMGAGDHDVYLQAVQPVIVEVPGVRAVCGYDRAIRVSLIRRTETGLPEGISGTDQRTNDSFSFPRWYLGRSGGGWLDARDVAEAIVSMNGPHDVVLRVYADARRDGPQVSIPLGRLEALVDGGSPRRHSLAVDQQKLLAAVRSLDQQLRDARAKGNR